MLEVAEQCPAYGGLAVYRARTLIELLNDSMEFTGECIESNSSRSSSIKAKIAEDIGFTIIPNPASNDIVIKLTKKYEGICNIRIANSLGEIVINNQRNCKDRKVEIQLDNLKQGVYSVSVSLGEKLVGTSKLIIVR